MLQILIASHGKYAEGIQSAASIIVGEKSHVSVISAYVDDIPLQTKIEEFFSNIKPLDQVIVLTDLFGGSVNQAVLPYIKNGNVYVIAGVNLALILEVVLLHPESEVSHDSLRMIVEESRKQLMFVNDAVAQESKDDFDF